MKQVRRILFFWFLLAGQLGFAQAFMDWSEGAKVHVREKISQQEIALPWEMVHLGWIQEDQEWGHAFAVPELELVLSVPASVAIDSQSLLEGGVRRWSTSPARMEHGELVRHWTFVLSGFGFSGHYLYRDRLPQQQFKRVFAIDIQPISPLRYVDASCPDTGVQIDWKQSKQEGPAYFFAFCRDSGKASAEVQFFFAKNWKMRSVELETEYFHGSGEASLSIHSNYRGYFRFAEVEETSVLPDGAEGILRPLRPKAELRVRFDRRWKKVEKWIQFGVGTSVAHSQITHGRMAISQYGLAGKLDARTQMKGSLGFSANLYGTLLPVLISRSSSEFEPTRFVGANARATLVLWNSFLGFRATLSPGFSIWGMLPNGGSSYGFTMVSGPQVFFALSTLLDASHILGIYTKYAPILVLPVDIRNRELAVGINHTWDSASHTFGIGLDYAWLIYAGKVILESKTLNLGLQWFFK